MIVSAAHLLKQVYPTRPVLPWRDIQSKYNAGHGQSTYEALISMIQTFCGLSEPIDSTGISFKKHHPDHELGAPSSGTTYVPQEIYGWVKEVPFRFERLAKAAEIAATLLDNRISFGFADANHAFCVYFSRDFEGPDDNIVCALNSSGGKTNTGKLRNPMSKMSRSGIIGKCAKWEVLYVATAEVELALSAPCGIAERMTSIDDSMFDVMEWDNGGDGVFELPAAKRQRSESPFMP